MKLRRRVRDTTSGEWAKAERATSDPAGTVTETARPVLRCPNCRIRLAVTLEAAGPVPGLREDDGTGPVD